MNVTSMNLPARTRSSFARWLAQPLEEWSGRRTACSAITLAVLVCVLGVQGWQASGESRREIAQSALDAAQTRASQTKRLVAELPELRSRAHADALRPEHWSAADALHAVAELAAQSGLRVSEIEPLQAVVSARAPASSPTDRALKFRAEGAFGEIRRFLDALSGLPRLVVPESAQIKRQTNALAIDATLRLHEALPAVPPMHPPRADTFVVDPFGGESVGRGADLLLVGTIVGRRRGMALIQNGPGVDGFVTGQQIGDERIRNVAPRRVELSGAGDESRTLSFAEDGK